MEQQNQSAAALDTCRPFDGDLASTFEVEGPWAPGQWLAGFQPEARVAADLQIPAAQDLPFPGLELGPVIGKGSFGYVCRGALGYLICAVKVSLLDTMVCIVIDMLTPSTTVHLGQRPESWHWRLDWTLCTVRGQQQIAAGSGVVHPFC